MVDVVFLIVCVTYGVILALGYGRCGTDIVVDVVLLMV